jgi:hypothetical protein
MATQKTEKLRNDLPVITFFLFSQIRLREARGKRIFFVSSHRRAIYTKTYLRFIVAGDVNSPQRHFCATLIPPPPCIVDSAYSSKSHTECTVVFSRQHWLREQAAMYISYLVIAEFVPLYGMLTRQRRRCSSSHKDRGDRKFI